MKAIRTVFSSQAKPKSSKMSEGKQKGQTVQPTKLALAELKSVQWAQDQQIVMSVQKSAATRYQSYKESLLFGWVIVLSEMYVVWWWTFVHNLPWPEPALNALDKADTFTFRTLDYTQQRLEWWWDMASVRLMWLKESIINFLDRNLTVADSYFAMLQDWSAAVYEFITHFISGIYQTVANITSENLLGQKATTSGALNKNLSMRRNSEGYEDDETGDEEYLSDASRNARRMAKEDSSGKLRETNGGSPVTPVRRIFPGILSKMGSGSRNPGSDSNNPGRDERSTLPRKAPPPRQGSQRSLARFFTSSSERKAESSNTVDAIGKSASESYEPKWYEQSPPTQPRSPAVLRTSAGQAAPHSPVNSPGSSPEGSRRGFGRFSLKRQRSRK